MPWAAGVFTRVRNWVTDKNGAINPQAALFDQEDDNFASGLNNCVTKDGLNKPSAAMDFNGQNLTGVAALTFTGDATGRGVGLCKVKTADTARISTTTLTDDPHLVLALAAGKSYDLEATLVYDGTTTAGMGIRYGLFYNNTIFQSFLLVSGNQGAAAFSVSPTTGAIGNSFGTVPITALGGITIVKGIFVTTNAGNLSVQWAQNSSTAQNLNMRQGSYLKVTQVS